MLFNMNVGLDVFVSVFLLFQRRRKRKKQEQVKQHENEERVISENHLYLFVPSETRYVN